MREQTPSAACNPGTAPMHQIRTAPASRSKWPIQYPKGMALLRAAMSDRVVVGALKGPTWVLEASCPLVSRSYRSASSISFDNHFL